MSIPCHMLPAFGTLKFKIFLAWCLMTHPGYPAYKNMKLLLLDYNGYKEKLRKLVAHTQESHEFFTVL